MPTFCLIYYISLWLLLSSLSSAVLPKSMYWPAEKNLFISLSFLLQNHLCMHFQIQLHIKSFHTVICLLGLFSLQLTLPLTSSTATLLDVFPHLLFSLHSVLSSSLLPVYVQSGSSARCLFPLVFMTTSKWSLNRPMNHICCCYSVWVFRWEIHPECVSLRLSAQSCCHPPTEPLWSPLLPPLHSLSVKASHTHLQLHCISPLLHGPLTSKHKPTHSNMHLHTVCMLLYSHPGW